MDSRKYLVLGSEGFVGKSLCKYFESNGHKVAHFDIKNGVDQDGRVVDLNLGLFDRICFLAWDVGGANYLYRADTQMQQMNNNINLLSNVFSQYEKIKDSKTQIMFVSSQLAEMGDTVYGATKRVGEVWCSLVGGFSLRLWNVYGPYEPKSDKSHVISDFIEQALSNNVINMQTNGDEKRQFIFIDDFCRAVEYGFDAEVSGVYDATTYQWISVSDIAEIIAYMTGASVVKGDRVGGTQEVMIKGRMRGWSPQVSIKKGLEKTIEEFKRHA